MTDPKVLELAREIEKWDVWTDAEGGEASQVARALVERETPVRVEAVHGMSDSGWFRCPVCKKQAVHGKPFCHECGARLEWV